MGQVSVNHGDNGVATSTAAAATCDHTISKITTEALTTAAGADYSFTLTSACINVSSSLFVTVRNGTNTTLYVVPHSVVPGAGSATFKVRNAHATVALNGTLIIDVLVN